MPTPGRPMAALDALHDPLRERLQALQGRRRRAARHLRRGPKGRIPLLGRPVRIGKVDVSAPVAPRGERHQRSHRRRRPRHLTAQSLEGPAASAQHRLRLPRLQAAADQDRLRERRVRHGSDRPATPRRAHAGPTGARPRRSGQEGRALPVGAVRWRAAAASRSRARS